MIKNNKGFMLIEVIVTATVVMTVMITFYVSFNKMYSNYKIRNSYYNLDAIYAIKEMINSMLKNDVTVNINSFINNRFVSGTSDVAYFIENSSCVVENTLESCNLFESLYGIRNMIFIKYNKDLLMNLADDIDNQTFKDYINYLIAYYDIENSSDEYSYIVLTEIENDNNYYYGNLRIR